MTEIEFLTGAPSLAVRVDRSEEAPDIEGWSEPRIVIEGDGEPKAESVEQGVSVSAEDSLVEPSVRREGELNRLQEIIRWLGYEPGPSDVPDEGRRRGLENVAAGRIIAHLNLQGR